MCKPKKLHPIAIVFITGKKIKELIFPFIAFVFFGNRGNGGNLFSVLASIGAVMITFIISLLSWFRYTYRMENGELRIEYGIFIRKKRYIPFERIQSVDISEGVLQRLFGLVKVQIETAGGSGADEAEAVLSAISKQEAQMIQEYVASAKGLNQGEEVERVQESLSVYIMTTSQLFLLSVTSGGIGVVFSAVFALISQLGDFISFKWLFGGIEKWAASSIMIIAALVFCGFLLAWVMALIATMLKYANFTVVKTDGDLIISQGMLERRQLTIPLNRIQAIRVSENMVRQLFGYASVYIESAGGSVAYKEGSKVILLPIVKVKDIGPIIEPNLTDYTVSNSFTKAPRRAMWRYIIRSCYWIVPIVIAFFVIFKALGLFSLLLLVVGVYWAVLKYRDAGWCLAHQQLSLRYRSIVRTTIFMKKNKIQCLKMKESYFQSKKELASIQAFVKSGMGPSGGTVLDLEKSDIQKIYSWYTRH